jgi:pseudouridine-5'-phosphate glycosidase/pseudouridine kinase
MDAARIMHAQNELNLSNGMVFAVPIPEKEAADFHEIPVAIDKALEECQEKQIAGKEVTPFLLKRVAQLTEGQSLKANIALIKNNARMGSRIAREFSLLRQPQRSFSSSASHRQRLHAHRPLFVGGAALDIVCKFKPLEKETDSWEPFFHTSSPCAISHSLGGVARNSAECCYRVATGAVIPHSHEPGVEDWEPDAFAGPPPILISPIGDDLFGQTVYRILKRIGMPTEGLISVPGAATAVYNALLDPQGKLIAAGASMDILTEPEWFHVDALRSKLHLLLKPTTPLVCVDANPSQDIIHALLKACRSAHVPLWLEPTSVVKCERAMEVPGLLRPDPYPTLMYASPNIEELIAMSQICEKLMNDNIKPIKWSTAAFVHEVGPGGDVQGMYKISEVKLRSFESLLGHIGNVLAFIPTLFIKLSKDGVMLAQRTATHSETYFQGQTGIRLRHYLPEPAVDKRIVNVTGAGDSFVGAVIAGLSHMVEQDSHHQRQSGETMYQKHIRLFHHEQRPEAYEIDKLVLRGREAAELSLLHPEAVHPGVGKLMSRV